MSPRETEDECHQETTPLLGLALAQISHSLGSGDGSPRCKESRSRTQKSGIYALVFGQMVTLFSISQSAASFTLEYGFGKVFPFFLLFGTYLILSLHLIFPNAVSSDEPMYNLPLTPFRLRKPWWYYLGLSFLDVSPNYFTLLALQHTSLTSTTLLGSLSVPSTMLFSWIFLRKRYKAVHFIGIALCLTGGFFTIWIDATAVTNSSPTNSPSRHPHSYYGDIFAVLAALLYGIGDTAGEFWSKHVDRREYSGMLGFFGSIFCFSFIILFEEEEISNLLQDRNSYWSILGIMVWFHLSLVGFYVLASLFLVSSDATLLLLSLQTSNLWAILYSMVAFHESPSQFFYAAAVMVVSGVFVYELIGNSPQNTAEETIRSVESCSARESGNAVPGV